MGEPESNVAVGSVNVNRVLSYSYIPHPMIVSQMVALLGFHKAALFRQDWPYVVPIHVTLYIVHMLQEMFNIYQKPVATGSLKLKQK